VSLSATEEGDSVFLRNVDTDLQKHTVPKPKTTSASNSTMFVHKNSISLSIIRNILKIFYSLLIQKIQYPGGYSNGLLAYHLSQRQWSQKNTVG
jgi:hypothetical protein